MLLPIDLSAHAMVAFNFDRVLLKPYVGYCMLINSGASSDVINNLEAGVSAVFKNVYIEGSILL